jgi:outer membrane protein
MPSSAPLLYPSKARIFLSRATLSTKVLLFMKKTFLFVLALLYWPIAAQAADLIEVYQQAQTSDPTFLQAVAQRLSTKEGLPINIAALLPAITASINPTVSRVGYAGSNFTRTSALTTGFVSPRNVTERTYLLSLTASQTVFNFAQFSAVAQQYSLSKSADATLNAALQALMIRVSSAYFAVLQDEENLIYNDANKLANAEQLEQVKQQYNVGLKTITDVYTAQAAYDTAVSQYIQAETTLANDRENLRVITGKYYPQLDTLSDNFPLIKPTPANMETWVDKAQQQNWSIKASQYQVDASRQVIRQQFAGHLPTVAIQGTLSRQYVDNINRYISFQNRVGPGTTSDKAIGLVVTAPLFSGGSVVAQTNQAVYNFEVSQQSSELVIRNTINNTRQSYLNVISGISKVTADKQAIKSNISSLDGMEASYQVGTETLVDVLNQQQKLFQAQTQYATDRYAYVNNLLLLKQAAGTLSFEDLRAINSWLTDKPQHKVRKKSTRALGYTSPGIAMNKNKKEVMKQKTSA